MGIDPALFEENERTQPNQTGRREVAFGPFTTEAGVEFPQVTIAYETWGEFRGDNAVLVCHALSGDSHAVGWWERMVGPGRAIDTDRYFVVCPNVLGGCQGSTGPSSLAPNGVPYGSRFGRLTVGDMVRAQIPMAEALGVAKWLLIAGGSMGGMIALEWAVRFPGRVQALFLTATCLAHNALQIGFNEAARQAIRRDAKWRGGDYPLDDPPRDGLAVARMLGHISFLSAEAFDAKFGRRRQPDRPDQFQVESYLNYQGDKFTRRFDPNSLLVLTDAIDRFDRSTLEHLHARVCTVGFTSDWLYPLAQSEAIAKAVRAAGGYAEHHAIDLPYGHDAFLLDGRFQAEILEEFLDDLP